jgi:hypothetical protein
VPCFRHPVVQLFMAGFLPFSAIYIELHYIFNSIWGHKVRCVALFSLGRLVAWSVCRFAASCQKNPGLSP